MASSLSRGRASACWSLRSKIAWVFVVGPLDDGLCAVRRALNQLVGGLTDLPGDEAENDGQNEAHETGPAGSGSEPPSPPSHLVLFPNGGFFAVFCWWRDHL